MKKLFLIVAMLFAFPLSVMAQAVPQPKLTTNWTDNSADEGGFKVERCAPTASILCTSTSTNFSQVATPAAGVTTHDDTGLPEAMAFCYRVRAYNTGGDSPYSNIACRTTRSAVVVSKVGTGTGTVTSVSAGINCGATCAALFVHGALVTLSAVAPEGNQFAGWSGACTGTETCNLTMDGRKNVTATFNAISPPAAPSGLGVGD